MFNAYTQPTTMPRHNTHHSTLATLRAAVSAFQGRQCTQSNFATMAGCAPVSIQKIELGQLRLSERLARRIAERTGASAEWLLKGRPTSHPQDAHGRRLTRETWLLHKEDLREGRQARLRLAVNVAAAVPSLASVAASAAKAGRLDIFAADLREAVEALAARYGRDERVFSDATMAMTRGEFPRISEPGFPATLPADRLCKVRLHGFGAPARQEPRELDLATAANDANVFSVVAEVKPRATAEEVRTIYPRGKAKASKARKKVA